MKTVKLQPLRARCPRVRGSQRQPCGGCAQLSGVGKCRLTQVMSARGYVVFRDRGPGQVSWEVCKGCGVKHGRALMQGLSQTLVSAR